MEKKTRQKKVKGSATPESIKAAEAAGQVPNSVLPGNITVLPDAKKKKEKLRMGPPKLELLIQHNFSNEEKLAIGEKLGRENQVGAELESQKKTVMSDFGAKINGVKANIQELSNQLGAGYEMRTASCLVHYDVPNREKYIYDADTGKFYRKESIGPADSQVQMSFMPPFPKGFVHGSDLPKQYISKVAKADVAAKAKK